MSDSEEDFQELLNCPGLYKEVPERKEYVNNKAAMRLVLNQLNNNLEWAERLDVVADGQIINEQEETKTLNDVNPNHDFERESIFQSQAEKALSMGFELLTKAGISTKRPNDYYAEMMKTDNQMKKINENLVAMRKKLEITERARQIREERKISKRVQTEIRNTRKDERETLQTAMRAARKKARKTGEKFNLENFLEEMKEENDASLNSKKSFKNGFEEHKSKVSKRRDYKNKIYGFGGQKKRSKHNTKESCMNASGFSVLTHQATPARIKKLQKQNKKQQIKNKKKQKSQLMKMS